MGSRYKQSNKLSVFLRGFEPTTLLFILQPIKLLYFVPLSRISKLMEKLPGLELVTRDDLTTFCQKADNVKDCGDAHFALCNGECLDKKTYKILLCDDKCQSSAEPCYGNCTGLVSLQEAHILGWNHQ